MLQIDTGKKQGAKRTRYFPESPDALLRKIVEEHPEATQEALEEIFEAEIRSFDGELLNAVIAYWFTNRYRALVRESIPPSVTRAKARERSQRLSDKVEQVKKATVAAVARRMMTEIAPGCGKPLARMTKSDCKKEGGWYLAVAKKLRAGETVQSSRLTDEDLWNLYNAA